jgi:hypothetical protein
MKILSYKETPNGTKILMVIGDARLDKLETEARAIAHVQGLPEFARLTDMIKESHALVKSLQSRRQKVADSVQYRDMLNQMASSKLELETLQAAYEDANPVHLEPANALLVDAETAKAVASMSEGEQYIKLITGTDGVYESCSVILNEFMGKCYRLPGSVKWETVEHPDETPPPEAVFTPLDATERDVIDLERIKGLDPEHRASEIVTCIETAENVYVRAAVLADTLTATEATKAKEAAKTALTEAKTAIEARYKI